MTTKPLSQNVYRRSCRAKVFAMVIQSNKEIASLNFLANIPEFKEFLYTQNPLIESIHESSNGKIDLMTSFLLGNAIVKKIVDAFKNE